MTMECEIQISELGARSSSLEDRVGLLENALNVACQTITQLQQEIIVLKARISNPRTR